MGTPEFVVIASATKHFSPGHMQRSCGSINDMEASNTLSALTEENGKLGCRFKGSLTKVIECDLSAKLVPKIIEAIDSTVG
jgi:hypothetical protein